MSHHNHCAQANAICTCLGCSAQGTLRLRYRFESSVPNKQKSSSTNTVTTSHEVCSSVRKGFFLADHLNVSCNTLLWVGLRVNKEP